MDRDLATSGQWSVLGTSNHVGILTYTGANAMFRTPLKVNGIAPGHIARQFENAYDTPVYTAQIPSFWAASELPPVIWRLLPREQTRYIDAALILGPRATAMVNAITGQITAGLALNIEAALVFLANQYPKVCFIALDNAIPLGGQPQRPIAQVTPSNVSQAVALGMSIQARFNDQVSVPGSGAGFGVVAVGERLAQFDDILRKCTVAKQLLIFSYLNDNCGFADALLSGLHHATGMNAVVHELAVGYGKVFLTYLNIVNLQQLPPHQFMTAFTRLGEIFQQSAMESNNGGGPTIGNFSQCLLSLLSILRMLNFRKANGLPLGLFLQVMAQQGYFKFALRFSISYAATYRHRVRNGLHVYQENAPFSQEGACLMLNELTALMTAPAQCITQPVHRHFRVPCIHRFGDVNTPVIYFQLDVPLMLAIMPFSDWDQELWHRGVVAWNQVGNLNMQHIPRQARKFLRWAVNQVKFYRDCLEIVNPDGTLDLTLQYFVQRGLNFGVRVQL